MLTITYETSYSGDRFETKLQVKFDKSYQSFEQQEEEFMSFKVKHHQEPKQIEKELIPLSTETLCLSEATEVLNETPFNISSQLIVQEKHISKIPVLFDNKFEQNPVNSIIEATKYEPETSFEKNFDGIKYDNVKSITSLDMNLSVITSN